MPKYRISKAKETKFIAMFYDFYHATFQNRAYFDMQSLIRKCFTILRKMHESAGYPSSEAKLPSKVAEKLLNLPGNSKMDLEWFKKNVWSETSKIEIPENEVICGMQANIYKINLSNNR